jgi:deoxyguanosine kinase
MHLPELPYSFIAIEGNIGSGKTTLAEMIGSDYEAGTIMEQFADNPFLPYFYENPGQYAFPLELFFMTERYKQLQTMATQQDMFYEFQVADYCFVKTLLFARHTLPVDEFRIFQKLWMVLEGSLPRPELIVYLHRPIAALLDNISRRGRSYEQKIQPAYLEQVQHAYFEYFRSEVAIPILVFDLQARDFRQEKGLYQEILQVISGQHRPGLQHISIH